MSWRRSTTRVWKEHGRIHWSRTKWIRWVSSPLAEGQKHDGWSPDGLPLTRLAAAPLTALSPTGRGKIELPPLLNVSLATSVLYER